MAAHFNVAFGKEVLLRPEWRFSKAPVVPGIDGAKMSKSYKNSIPIFLPEGMTEKQAWKTYFASIVTDSKGVEEPKEPNDTLMTLYRLLAPEEAAEFEPIYVRGGVGYGELKKRLHAAYEQMFAPFRDKRAALAKDEPFIEGVLEEGGQRARAIAREVMDEVRAAAGIVTGSWSRRQA
jgi:tryptophanyl-tRNA synthetase